MTREEFVRQRVIYSCHCDECWINELCHYGKGSTDHNKLACGQPELYIGNAESEYLRLVYDVIEDASRWIEKRFPEINRIGQDFRDDMIIKYELIKRRR